MLLTKYKEEQKNARRNKQKKCVNSRRCKRTTESRNNTYVWHFKTVEYHFGMAIKKKGKKKFDYYINPVKFYEYIGKPLPDKYKEKEETQVQGAKATITVITDPSIAKTMTWKDLRR